MLLRFNVRRDFGGSQTVLRCREVATPTKAQLHKSCHRVRAMKPKASILSLR
jgi:hypothetical protein